MLVSLALEFTHRIDCHQDGGPGTHTDVGFSLASLGDGIDHIHFIEILIFLFGSGEFALCPPFSVVLAQVAVLADSMSVLRPVDVRTG